MSTLTKILIVLLTLSSIFLCGIVVTYVANAEDYREQNKTLRITLRSAKENEKGAKEQSRKTAAEGQRLETRLNIEIASLQTEIRELENNLKNTEREKAKLLQKVTDMASVVQTTSQTAEQQTRLFENAQAQLKTVKQEQIKERKELNDVTAELNVKMAIIATLEADVKRLKEEKTDLQSRLDRFLLGFGKETVAPIPVTPRKTAVRPAPPIAKKLELKGLVTAVDLKNSVAEISIGTAHGVKEGMKFYVIRGDEFICEILIHHVDAEKAVGTLKLVQKQPRPGDSVSTNL